MTSFDWSWLEADGSQLYIDFLTSLTIGLLIGLERERNPAAKAGLRTFALVAMFGALCGLLSRHLEIYWLLGVGLSLVGLMIIAAYFEDKSHEADPGTTTTAAVLACFTLGAAVMLGFRQLAVMLGVVTTVLLYFKAELSGVARGLERRDLLSILQFAALTFVILPVLPDENMGPFGAINPRNVWLMVVLISGISLAGYLALHLAGRRYGLALLGFLGGLVSSTATTLVYARHGKESPAVAGAAVVVILLANLVVLLRLALVTWVASPALLPHLLPVLASALAAGVVGLFWYLKPLTSNQQPPMLEIKNPTELRAAFTFAAIYAVVLLVAAWVNNAAGSRGLYAVALASGLTDVDAITLSSLRLLGLGSLEARQAVTAITIAFIANLAFKLGIVVVAGGATLARRCAVPMSAMAVAAAAALLMLP